MDLLSSLLPPPPSTQGGDLDQKIKESKESGRGFDVTLIVDWFIQLTTAIMYIHERRILHRDIKTRYIVCLPYFQLFCLHGS